MQPTRQVSLRDAKVQLSRLADLAHQGDTVVLTKRGRAWARLVPLEAGPVVRRCLRRLLQEGLEVDPHCPVASPPTTTRWIRSMPCWWPRPSWMT